MRYLRLLFILASILNLSTAARGWDDTGHQQVADIARTRLNDKAKAEVKAILAAGGDRYMPAANTESSARNSFRRTANLPGYKEIKEGDVPSPAYDLRRHSTCRSQAVLAGYRLASLLNKTLGSAP